MHAFMNKFFEKPLDNGQEEILEELVVDSEIQENSWNNLLRYLFSNHSMNF